MNLRVDGELKFIEWSTEVEISIHLDVDGCTSKIKKIKN